MKRKKQEIIEGTIKDTGYFESFIFIDDEPINRIFEDYVNSNIKITIETEED